MPVETVQADTVLAFESEPLGRVVVEGARNTLRIGKEVVLKAAVLIHGSGCRVEIGDGCNIDGVIRIARGEGGLIRIGRGTSIVHAALTMHEASRLTLGEDCMISSEVHMDVSDMHPIYDRTTGERLNPAEPITVGDHVWVGKRVIVCKGATIGSGSVIGAGSMVIGAVPEGVIAVGTPARPIRENIEWRRDFDEPFAGVVS